MSREAAASIDTLIEIRAKRMTRVDAEALRRPLGDLGEGLAGQLAELQARLSVERTTTVLMNLQGAIEHVRALRCAMASEGEGDGQ